MTEKDLLRLKEQIDEAQTKVSELKGQLNAYMKQLKDEWECESVEEGQKKLKSLKKQIEKLELSIEESTKEIEDKYDL